MTSLGVTGFWCAFGFCFSNLRMDVTSICKLNTSLLSRQYCQVQQDTLRPAGQCTYLKVRLVQFHIVSNAPFCYLKDADSYEYSATPDCSHFM